MESAIPRTKAKKTKNLNELEGLELLEQVKKSIQHENDSTQSFIPTFNDNETNIDNIKLHLDEYNNLLKVDG